MEPCWVWLRTTGVGGGLGAKGPSPRWSQGMAEMVGESERSGSRPAHCVAFPGQRLAGALGHLGVLSKVGVWYHGEKGAQGCP